MLQARPAALSCNKSPLPLPVNASKGFILFCGACLLTVSVSRFIEKIKNRRIRRRSSISRPANPKPIINDHETPETICRSPTDCPLPLAKNVEHARWTYHATYKAEAAYLQLINRLNSILDDNGGVVVYKKSVITFFFFLNVS